VRERFRILSAFRVPDAVRPHLYPGISPVNAFRVILRYGYACAYDRIPDESRWYLPTRPNVLVRTNPGT
jgi:hypothetical protein